MFRGESSKLLSLAAAALVTVYASSARGQGEIPPAPAPVAPVISPRAVELWQDKPLGELKASISLDLPDDEKLSETEKARLDQASPILMASGHMISVFGESRPWMLNTYEWEAPATRHLPLLFEEPNLERLGYTVGMRTYWDGCEGSVHAGEYLQPFFSAAHFFGRVPAIPYLCGVDDPFEPVYTLGVDRPGSPLLYQRHFIPWSLRGAILQAGAVIGLAYAIP
jgi:hypothetical protein